MVIYLIAFVVSIISYLLFSKSLVRDGRMSRHEHSNDCKIGLFEKRPMLPFVISAMPLILVSGLRYNVGTDYFKTYYTGFYRVMQGNGFDKFEIGYVALVKLIQVFTSNVFVLFFITSVITIGFTFAAVRHMSSNVAFSILLFMISRYYFIGLNAVRQMMACAVFSYALVFALRRDLKKYLVFALLAVSFHYSTLILVPTYWLMMISWTPKKTILTLMITGILGTVAFPILAYVLPSASKWGIILANYSLAGSLFIFGTIVLNIFILIVYYSVGEHYKHGRAYQCFLYLQIMAVAMTLLLPSIPVVERVYWSFSYASIICLPAILSNVKPVWWRAVARSLLIGVLAIYTAYDIGILYDHQVIPYDSIIGKEPEYSTDFGYRQTHNLNRWYG